MEIGEGGGGDKRREEVEKRDGRRWDKGGEEVGIGEGKR